MANKAIKYRVYPTDEQSVMFTKTFGCCRKVYNLMLSDKIDGYKATGKFPTVTPAKYKNDYPYLREVDSLALANKQMDLQKAFLNRFSKSRKKKNGFPKFKSAKHSRKSYTTNNQKGTVAIIENKYIKLPKIGKVKAVIHRIPDSDWKLKSATISQDSDGKFYVSVLFAYEDNIRKIKQTNNAIGLDYKSDGLYADSNGQVCGSPKYYRKSQKKLTKLQRQLSRKQKGSNNRNKARIKVARLHKHISNQRLDFLHKKSTEIANQYDVVCVETLDMKSISNKGFGNGKATFDNGYGTFLNMLEYKLNDRGKYFVKVEKWYPSSQICCKCGSKHKLLLSDRVYKCECGNIIDRDYNAAINILNEGLKQIA